MNDIPKPAASQNPSFGLPGSEHKHAKEAQMVNPPDPNLKVRVNLIVRRKLGAPPLPDFEYFRATPRNLRKMISHEDFERLYGASQEDIEKVMEFSRANGLQTLDSNRERRTVIVEGTITQMNKAFQIELKHFVQGKNEYRGHVGPVYLPASLNGIVEALIGLDTRPLPIKHLSADPANTALLDPVSVANLYHFPPGDGAGQVIGIFETDAGFQGSGFSQTDINATMAAWPGNLTPPVPQVINVHGQIANISTPETLLDITVAAAVAQKATIVVYNSEFSYFLSPSSPNYVSMVQATMDALQRMIHPGTGDPVPTIISISYRWDVDNDTTQITPAEFQQYDQLFQAAAFLGITIILASGDTGVLGVPGTTVPEVSWPASSPWVLACGGTTIGDINGSSFEEFVWNDTFPPNLSGATGGGVSALYPLPGYQQFSGIPNSLATGNSGRGVPDIAGNASPNSGYSLVIQNVAAPIGGTSAVAPLYAGLIARINANLGFSVGNINLDLYQSGGSVCRDVNPTSTNPPSGPLNNSFSGIQGYPAGPGWDACTGWGSIDGEALQTWLSTNRQRAPVVQVGSSDTITITIGGENDGSSMTFVYQFGHLIKIIHNPPIFWSNPDPESKLGVGHVALLAISSLGSISSFAKDEGVKESLSKIEKDLVKKFRKEIEQILK
jgi:kumamolisin